MNLTINSEYMKNNVKMKMQTPSYFLRVSTIISLLIIFNVTICLAQNPKLETIDSGGFLTSHWTQDYPYNQLCPRDPVNNYSYSYAGCPAVAMGQILNFLRTTQETRFSDSDDYSHNYAGRNYNIDDDWESLQFPSFPQLNELLDSIDVSFQRGERLDDIQAAALIFACGTACTQVYTSEGSGTFAVSQAYEAYQRFGFSECTLFYDADSTMFATLISNLQEGYPAHLAVENPEGTIGHNVVVDGYRKEDGKFHMDFGYGGALDGWYDIPDPNFYYGMTKMEGIILNIIPTNTPSSINEKSPEKSLVVYPNPTSDLINIENFSDKTTAYSIFNVTGQEIKTGFTSGKISVSELEKGIYFLQIKDEKLYKMIKFVKK